MTEYTDELNNMESTELATTDAQRVSDIESEMRNRAQMTMWSLRQVSPAAEIATLRHAEKLNLPPATVRQMDNAELDKIDASAFSYGAQELIAKNPSLGILFRNDASLVNSMVESIELGKLPAEVRKQHMEWKVRNEGYTPEQIVALKQAGYKQDADGIWYAEEDDGGIEPTLALDPSGITTISYRKSKKRVQYPLLPEWYLGPTERAAAVNAAVLGAMRTGETASPEERFGVSGRELSKALLRDIQLVSVLNQEFGNYWKSFDDDELTRLTGFVVDAVNKKAGKQIFSADGLDLSRLRARSIKEPTEFFSNLVNVFGIPEAIKAMTGTNSERIARIVNNLDSATADEINALNDYLLEEHRGVRGSTTGVSLLEGFAETLRFVGEMYATKKLAGGNSSKVANAPFWKRWLGKAGAALLEEGNRLSAYVPAIMAKEFAEPNNLTLDFDETGEMEAALTPKVAGEMSANIFNAALNQYFQNVSERAGGILDDIVPAGKLIENVVSPKIKSAVVAKAATDVFGKMTKTQWVKTLRSINEAANLNGVVPEIGEEYVGKFFNAVSTRTAQYFGTRFGDLGNRDMFGSTADELAMMAQVGLNTALLRAPVMIGSIYERRKLANFVDLQSAVKEGISQLKDFSQSPQAVKAFYLQTGLPQAAHITPEKLREISEGEKGGEVLEALGISESEIAEAEVNENVLVVNLADAMANLDPEIHGELMKRVTQFSSASIETLSDWDDAIAKKAVDDRIVEAKEFEEAYDKAIAELTALDLPDSTIRAAAKIFGNFAHYFGRESSISGAEWIRSVGFNMMKESDWEDRVNQALYQISPVWTGSAASYDKPSLQYIGTGEGAQVFGWGLYGSSSRSVAEWYAKTDVSRKHSPRGKVLSLDGKPFEFMKIDTPMTFEEYYKIDEETRNTNEAMHYVYRKGSVEEAIRHLELILRQKRSEEDDIARGALEWLKANGERVEYKEVLPHNLYKQTFWPDKQEDLLDWDGKLTQAQVEKIMAQVEKDPRFEKEDYEKAKAERGHYTDVEPDKYYVWEYDEDGNKTAGHGFSRSWLEQYADPEKEWATAGDFYEQLAYTFGSPKAASEFLYAAGIDGVTYIGDASGMRNYVAFSDNDIRIDEHIMYQTGGLIKKGATSFNPNIDKMSFNETWEATITLFEGAADASTLIHEIEHYAHRMMELLVEAGMASDRMRSDLAKLKQWGTLSPEAAQKGYDEYVAELKKADPKAVPASFEVWKDIQYHENVAKGLEAFVLEGKGVPAELIGAFAHLKQILKSIYNTVEALGVNLDDNVRNVFRGMMATDETIAREDVMGDVLKSIEGIGLLGMNQDELKDFKRLVALRNDQMAAKLDEEKAAQLKELKKQWEKEAQQLIDEDRAMSTWQSIVEYGGMNYKAVEQIAGKAAADELLKRGLLREVKKSVSKGGTHPATFAANHGYESVDEMLIDLMNAQDPAAFKAEFLNECEQEFHKEFQMTESAMSVQATTDALNLLAKNLEALRGKEGKAIRLEELHRRAEAYIGEKTGAWIVSDRSLVKETQMAARNLTHAISKKDYDAALREVEKLREKLEFAKYKAEAKAVLNKFKVNLKKAVRAKKGSMDGHYQDALRDLSDRLRFTKPLSRDLTATVASVIKAYNEANPGAKFELIPEAESGTYSAYQLPYWKLREIASLAEFLRIEGKDIVSEAHKQAREARAKALEFCVEGLKNSRSTEFKEDNMFAQGASLAISVSSKLRNIIGWADNWDPEGALTKYIYEPFMRGESYAGQLANEAHRAAKKALEALTKRCKKWDLNSLNDIQFPEDLRRRFKNYTKWDAKKVYMACLNMGNATNRQRLIDGFEWGDRGEEYCNRIASLLSSEDWENIQKVWDAVNNEKLVSAWKAMFHKIYHYDLPVEEPMSFQVQTSDGKVIQLKGGYIPLKYATLKKSVAKEEGDSKGRETPVEYVRAGFNRARVQGFSAPLDLNFASIVTTHIDDVARFVTINEVSRQVLPVIRDTQFRTEFVLKWGVPRYNALLKLCENIAAPGEWMKGHVSALENKLRAVTTARSLWFSLSTALQQPTSLTIGLEEVGRFYGSALAEITNDPMGVVEMVRSKSGFMENRVGKVDPYAALRVETGFTPQRFDIIKKAGGALADFTDATVAVPAWLAMYRKALADGKTERDAIAEADEFVARTQGGVRPIDLSPSDLSVWGRLAIMFNSAQSAQWASVFRAAGRGVYKRTDAATNIGAVAFTFMIPLLASAYVRWLTGRKDDEDENFAEAYWSYIWRDALSFNVLGDMAIDIFDNREPELTALRAAKDSYRMVRRGAKALGEGDWKAFAYQAADLVSSWYEIPVVPAYERVISVVEDWADEDISLDIKENIGLKKPNQKRR